MSLLIINNNFFFLPLLINVVLVFGKKGTKKRGKSRTTTALVAARVDMLLHWMLPLLVFFARTFPTLEIAVEWWLICGINYLQSNQSSLHQAWSVHPQPLLSRITSLDFICCCISLLSLVFLWLLPLVCSLSLYTASPCASPSVLPVFVNPPASLALMMNQALCWCDVFFYFPCALVCLFWLSFCAVRWCDPSIVFGVALLVICCGTLCCHCGLLCLV